MTISYYSKDNVYKLRITNTSKQAAKVQDKSWMLQQFIKRHQARKQLGQ